MIRKTDLSYMSATNPHSLHSQGLHCVHFNEEAVLVSLDDELHILAIVHHFKEGIGMVPWKKRLITGRWKVR